jgi:macrolide-specific efflux system membrane fusion protein
MSALSFALCTSLAAAGQAGQPAESPKGERPFEMAAVIKIAEEAEVPAAEAGVLESIEMKEGQFVEEGQKLAGIRDKENRLKVERAALETDIALRKFQNDLDIRFAKKSTEVAKAELARSLETNVKFPKTVSNTELDRQRLLVEQGELETKKAEHEQEIAGLTHQIKANEHRTTEEELSRRTIAAPLGGMVVEVHRRRGEWVNPGETVARIVRMDRLRAEGFLAARHARLDLVESKVKLKVAQPDGTNIEVPGEIVFVSPEIDPLNNQVRVWADVDNAELKLRPGMQATVTLSAITPEQR